MVRNPTFLAERELMERGFRAIAGVDEAGTGALAGPVVAAAVIFPLDSRIGKVRDSKLLAEGAREDLYDMVIERAAAHAVGIVSVVEIEGMGLRRATLLAMRRAVESIASVDYVLVDAWTIPGLATPQHGIIHGDRLVKSIAAASIVAKVTRDRLMRELSQAYPAYGFDIHKGYATAEHRCAIQRHGPCPAHRLSYKTFHPPIT
ncbi:ribonuclease HII [Candidatus Uhrbacteria bacterium RIFCSPHIGHO2_01_FULL_63_20]|uniref:Ribonuclease HII n=1 Tax=Candidatus Uhrbacteria bacterium RIFCSPHIGHO2_01_FULL_63_20 TaxID=1802385 RepID=A0A1F7TNE6_9BACT|nr:MAG: ribonuclease HII [Candidatus Uhrbacteria bacterium RIFCSPHIGHO2_01_FULL_63_20]